MNLSELLDLHRTANARLRPLAAAVRLNRPARIDRDTTARVANEIKQHPVIRRFPKAEQDRMHREVRAELQTTRRTAGAVARYRANDVRQLVRRGRAAIETMRQDVFASMPDVLNGVSKDGMIMLHLLNAQQMSMLGASAPGQLLAVYADAMRRKDVLAYVQVSCIEQLARAGAFQIQNDDDRRAARELRDYIDGVEEVRLPTDLPDFDQLEAQVNRLDALCDAISVQPLDPEQQPGALEIFEQLVPELEAAADEADEPAKEPVA